MVALDALTKPNRGAGVSSGWVAAYSVLIRQQAWSSTLGQTYSGTESTRRGKGARHAAIGA
jgi:hypothetical protein